MKRKYLILLTILAVTFTGFCCFLLVQCIQNYLSVDVGYEDFTYEELTFDRYEEVIKIGRRGRRRIVARNVYFQEYEEPFGFPAAVLSKVDFDALKKLGAYETVSVYITTEFAPKQKLAIGEMKTENEVILSLSDYAEAIKENQFGFIFICAFAIVLGILLTIISVIFYKRAKQEQKSPLGRLILEYSKNGNKICVYNAISTCSLVINGDIVDKFEGMVASPFCLMGMVLDEWGNEVFVKAKMGFVFMRLYYNNEVVGKKCMLFG